MTIEGKFLSSILKAYEYLKRLRRPYTAEMFHSVVRDAFPSGTPRELKLGFKQLYHHVLCREGVLVFRENHGIDIYYPRSPVRREDDSRADYGAP
ncbi:unnamed protein product [Angiostrongylus costaricensis]|uniref:DUF2087 domain-containing protein n=1 Tax=Angiostrongylus costaricensis TaxID=334426 RepID=A0A0R3PT75_ANGCS|nr:unnamed protein product [Angiostrongylus costaricensis]